MKNTGFIVPNIEEKHYVMGAGNVPFQVLRKDGDWTKDLASPEYQSRDGLETCNCTGFGLAKKIREYMKESFGIDFNPSERWIGIVAHTRPPGNDPQAVYEAVREYGLISEEMLPFSDDIKTVDDYYSFKGSDEDACWRLANEWKNKYNFLHEWVFDPTVQLTPEERIRNMNVALKYSPLGVAVYAWITDERGVYVKLGPENHWTNIYKIDDFLNIFDSYDPYFKKADQVIIYCKRIHIELRDEPLEEGTDIGSVILRWIKRILQWIKII